MFQISNLSKNYGQEPILQNLNLEIQPGEIVGIVGENGAGKSTLFDIISGFESSHAGQIYLKNQPIHQLAPFQRANLGLARTFQLQGLFPNLSVYENLELGFRLPNTANLLEKLQHFLRLGDQTQTKNMIAKALDRVGMKDKINKTAKDLSGGQQKLVELARVMLQDWKILLLDEPLAGVSKSLKADLATKILTLKDPHKSIIIIEHDLEFISTVADRVLTLRDGQLWEVI